MSDIEKCINDILKSMKCFHREIIGNESFLRESGLNCMSYLGMRTRFKIYGELTKLNTMFHNLKEDLNKLDKNNNTQILTYLQKIIYNNINKLPCIMGDIHMISVLERMISCDKNIIIKHNINKENILDLLIYFEIDYKIKRVTNLTSLFVRTLYYIKTCLPKSKSYKTLPNDIRKYL